jgi:hypothetical protein
MSVPLRQTLAVLLSSALLTPVFSKSPEPGVGLLQKTVKVEQEWKGGSADAKDNDAWKLAPPDGVIAGPKSWEWFCKEWRLGKETPKVDFARELLLVTAGPGQNSIKMDRLTLNEAGDLTYQASSKEGASPGFTFLIQKINRSGIKSVAGKPIAIEPHKDPKTGFVVGGKNETALIKKLTEINGIAIAELEKKMKPQALSRAGFLGEDEKLLSVLAADNSLVVEELGLTHQELARHLQVLAAVGNSEAFAYHGRKIKVTVNLNTGFINSPFADGTKTNADIRLHNLANGKKVQYSLLVPLMIERYGFYEGLDTPYRVDPRLVVEVLDFLK